jgi:hypothetical protein
LCLSITVSLYPLFFNPNAFSPPEMLLKSYLEYTSCACVAFFTLLALTQAGSCKRPKEKNKGPCF